MSKHRQDGHIGNPTFQYVTTNLKPLIRTDNMEGKEWIVAPAQMITEGVHNGSDGPIFYPAEELAKVTAVWNYKPVVVYHPEVNGISVSACTPDQLSTRKVGVLMNTKWDEGGNKLSTETWLDPEKIETVDSRVSNAIKNNEMMEVSTGLFMDLERVEGEWNGEPYIGIARNMQPDHLALLPDMKGACSIEDGAGFLRLNQAGDSVNIKIVNNGMDMVWVNKDKGIRAIINDKSIPETFLFDETKWDGKKAKEWVKNHKKGISVNEIIFNELSHDDIRFLLRSSLDKDKQNAWIETVMNSFFIYEENGKLYKQNYTVNNNQVNFEGLPKLVEKQVTYKEILALNANTSKKTNLKGLSMDKKKMIDELIANERTSWSEEDRDSLMALPDKVLTNMCTDITELSKTSDTEDEVKETPATNQVKVENTVKPTAEQYIQNAPPEIREVLASSLATMNAEKKRLINVITSNERNTFTEEFLKTKTVDELRGIAAIAAPIANKNDFNPPMFVNDVVTTDNSQLPEPLPLPTMNFDKK